MIGDAPAHTVAQVASKAAQTLRQFVGARMPGAKGRNDMTGETLPGDVDGRNQP
ncbi:hypothetical protein D3C80_2027050 [compost metagenome]